MGCVRINFSISEQHDVLLFLTDHFSIRIDMLNQLYTIMDHLASKFNLYKVETIGDAYMCCSGLPTPDENHAQNIANFALAVSECVQLVESPADGTPLQLRIGIHTGHCMGGVVGTLTPHYCLFGDMVNTTSRHESTSLNGKIQCSSTLYEHLAEYTADKGGPQYKFTPRGYVKMKGKGHCFTYWLDSGTRHNEAANARQIKLLCNEVKTKLSKNKWKKRKYFNYVRRKSSGGYDDATLAFPDDTTISTGISGISFTDDVSGIGGRRASTMDSISGYEAGSAYDGASGISSDDDILSGFETKSYIDMKHTIWSDISWDAALSRIDLVAAIHGLLSSMLWKCAEDSDEPIPDNKQALDSELLRFVDRISALYEPHPFHSWDHACQVTLSATFLVKEYNDNPVEGSHVDKHPFVRFITVVSD
jgi:class 3 adenylate cyclase